jgi:hypothetical protein
VDNFTNDLCAKLPLRANSPGPELALEFAPPIHSAGLAPKTEAQAIPTLHNAWCAYHVGEYHSCTVMFSQCHPLLVQRAVAGPKSPALYLP